MAKVTGPLHSIAASGSVSNMLTFTNTRRGAVVKKWAAPSGPASVSQTAQRAAYLSACSTWNNLSAPEKEDWAIIGAARSLTGFNAFLSENIGAPVPPSGPQFAYAADGPALAEVMAVASSADGSIIACNTFNDGADQGFIEAIGGTRSWVPFMSGGSFNVIKDINAAGTTCIGNGDMAAGSFAFRYTLGGSPVVLPLPATATGSECTAISSDNSKIAGTILYETEYLAAVWNGANEGTPLALAAGIVSSTATSISPNGDYIAGTATDGYDVWACYWDAIGDMILLDLPADHASPSINFISNDGLVMAGIIESPDTELAIWWESDGTAHLVDLLPGEDSTTYVGGAADGSVLLGWSFASLDRHMFTVAPGGVPVAITNPLNSTGTQPRKMTPDGLTIVGSAYFADTTRGFVYR